MEDPVATAALRGEAKVLLVGLASHMSFEDRYLADLLRESGAWGERRCAQLAEDHREQRTLLEHLLRQLNDSARPERLVAINLLDLIALLREDIREEEDACLSDPQLHRSAETP